MRDRDPLIAHFLCEAGTVTVENMGLPGVTVRLSGMADAEMTTDNAGAYKFDALRGGTYSVEISGFPDTEVSFSSTSGAATVGVGETKLVSFDGTYVRTAGIQGQVSADGDGLPGVTVTLVGEGEDRTEITNATGNYSFANLKRGTYQVGITNPDPDDYEFATTSKTATIATGEVANVPFEGTLLRTAGIAGRVGLDDGMGLDGVTVTLAGAAEATRETSNGGQYSFAGLAAGTYVLSITNPNPTAYNFAEDEMQKTVMLADDQTEIVNFSGTHTRTAQISGMLFIDEVAQDKMYTTGEPSITEAITPLVAAGELDPAVVAGLLAKAKVKLRGPDLGDPPQDIAINADGSFTTGESLVAGSYQVELPVNDDDVAAGLAAAGVAFVGESMVVTVEAGGSEIVNFPFRITMQTVSVGAVMGTRAMITDPPRPVEDVELELYPTAEDAEDGTNMLSAAGATNEMGLAVFSYARADDTNPAGEATDNLVFVKVVGHHDDLSVSDNPIIEIEYPGVARVHAAPAHVRLLNTAVRFQFWVKSDMDARSGDMPLAGWHTAVTMGDGEDALMKPDPEDETMMVNLTDPTEGDDEGEEMGKATVSYMVTPDDLADGGATFTVTVSPDTDDWAQPMAMGEMWEEVGDDRLMHTHTGFELPTTNTHEMNDLGPTYVTFKTQKLTVGAYREADDEPGFTDFQSRVAAGDHRPASGVDLNVSVMVEASGRRGLEVYDKWDHDGNPDTDPIDATLALSGGMATFVNLPADMDFTVHFDEGSNRVAVGGPDSRSDRVQTFGADLDLGKSVGAFGDMSGAGPEVKLCPLTTDMRPSSLGDDDSDCATFAYQWMTGSITGGLDKAVKDLDVDIEAETDVHSEAPSATETDAAGSFSFSGIQDGVYTVTMASSDDYRVVPAGGRRVPVYHDETMDSDPNDNIFGDPTMEEVAFSATRLRLEIRGYAANVSHEENQVVRGDETYEGAMLELYAYDKDSNADIKTTGSVVATAEVQADGLYVFDNLDDGSYTIVAKNTDDYEMYHKGGEHYRNNVTPTTYGTVPEDALSLPAWDYDESTVSNNMSAHDTDEDGETDFTFYNFALLHGDGDFSGRVYEAAGEPDGVAVGLRRCETFTPADDGDTPDDLTDDSPAQCAVESVASFPRQTANVLNSGRWDFSSLREGNYVVNIAAPAYNRAKWDGTTGRIDDDATNCIGTTGTTARTATSRLATDPECDTDRTDNMYDVLKGKRAFNRTPVSFYIYNATAPRDDALTAIKVVGHPPNTDGTVSVDSAGKNIAAGRLTIPTSAQADGGSEAIDGGTARLIIWKGGTVNVSSAVPGGTAVSTGASYSVWISNEDPGDSPTSFTYKAAKGNTATLPTTKTTADGTAGTGGTRRIAVRVTAANGYHDHDYTFDVTRAAPADNNLVSLVANTNESNSGTAITINNSDGNNDDYSAGNDEYRATVPTATSAVYLRAGTNALQSGIAVRVVGETSDLTRMPTYSTATLGVYRVTVPATGVVNKTVTITVTSEDGVPKIYYLTLNR